MSTQLAHTDQLSLLRQLYPVKGLMHIGVGPGWSGELYKSWNLEKVILVEANPKVVAGLRKAFVDQKRWIILQELISNSRAPAAYFVASNQNESGLIQPERLQPIQQNLITTGRLEFTTQTIKSLLETPSLVDISGFLNWIVIDCIPAHSIIEGMSDLIGMFDVVVARAISDEHLERALPEASKSVLVDFMAKHRFATIDCVEERHPAFVQLLFVRDWKALHASAVAEGEREGRMLKASASEQQAVRDQLQGRVRSLEESVTKLTTERDALNSNAEQLAAAIGKHKAALEAQTQHAFEQTAKLEKLQEQIAQRDTQSKSLMQVVDEAKASASEQQTARDQLQGRVRSLEESVTKLTTERDALNSNVEQLTAAIGKHKAALEAQTQRGLETERQLKESEAACLALEEKKREMEARDKLIDKEIVRVEAQIGLMKEIVIREKLL